MKTTIAPAMTQSTPVERASMRARALFHLLSRAASRADIDIDVLVFGRVG